MTDNVFLKAVRNANLLRELQDQFVPELLTRLRTEDGVYYTASRTLHRDIDMDLVNRELDRLLVASSSPGEKWTQPSTSYEARSENNDYTRVTFVFKRKPISGNA